jgi:hypothetical protein
MKTGLLRVLVPSWRFFGELSHSSHLFYRVDGGEWLECLPRTQSRRSLGSLFLNPRGNLRLACNTLVDQLLMELETVTEDQAETLVATTSYRLVENLVRHQFAGICGLTQFQFKITTVAIETGEAVDAIVSAEHPC